MKNSTEMRISHHFQYNHSDCTIISNNRENIEKSKAKFYNDIKELENFVNIHKDWRNSYIPLLSQPAANKNSLIYTMEQASLKCNVGPMAAVAGAIADRMVSAMIQNPKTTIAVVENGGEISINSKEDIIIGLMVLSTTLQSKLGFRYKGGTRPIGVATSSSTFGHAESFGEADAVVVFASNAALADAAATYICNNVKGKEDKEAINAGLEVFDSIPQLLGVLIVKNQLIGKKGKLPTLIRIKDEKNILLQKKIENI
ncbi:MAG: UPF0280 family protein [Candidatus Lokiarchaeota archaeon]|nr:UPF0280 family protein [Candidatus Harpocratesius repetitus]